jgi:hypothetical protein
MLRQSRRACSLSTRRYTASLARSAGRAPREISATRPAAKLINTVLDCCDDFSHHGPPGLPWLFSGSCQYRGPGRFCRVINIYPRRMYLPDRRRLRIKMTYHEPGSRRRISPLRPRFTARWRIRPWHHALMSPAESKSVVVVGSINEDVVFHLGRSIQPGETVTAERGGAVPGKNPCEDQQFEMFGDCVIIVPETPNIYLILVDISVNLG